MLVEHMPTLVHLHEHRASVAIVLDVAYAMQHSPSWDDVVFVGIMLYMTDHMLIYCRSHRAVEADGGT